MWAACSKSVNPPRLSLTFVNTTLDTTMPPPTSSQKPAGKAAAAPANGKAPAKAAEHHDDVGGKPDQAKYNAEQDALNKEIAGVKTKLVSRLSLGSAVAVRFGQSRPVACLYPF